MASFGIALQWTLDFEDPQRKYAVEPDVGGYAVAGVNSHVFPQDYVEIAAAPVDARPALVATFYRTHFWNKWLEQLTGDELAKRVFDAGVNMGTGTAVKLLQAALQCPVDGTWGPLTMQAANTRPEAVEAFKTYRCEHYRFIAEHDATKQKYLVGWLSRAGK